MKKILTITILLFLHNYSFGQEKYNPLYPPNTYQNEDNPNYWKNKKPYADYWQQDVHYKIKATINEETDIISAQQILEYTNNSPDSLEFVYFHLYQNAFQPESYLTELQHNNYKKPKYGEYEIQKLGTKIEKISVEGESVKIELDNTILKVYLPETLKPNEKITFDIDFKSYFDQGDLRRRMKVFNAWGNKHYNGVHWYPRICVYDAKFGWTTDQHLGKEFYGNFGCFDVELNFASNFIVEATGFLLNRDSVLPNELRKKLDIKNFKDKKWNSVPSVIIPYKKGERKIWRFHAENVHDFAFTADPTYRIGEASWEDKTCYSLVQEPHASKWQNAADFGAKCLEVFSEDFGRYVYHKVIVADARSGMEYPMITLDGGSDPGYRDLLAHEIGHMWFFGQVGNNETYRALLDEGFTQFLTAWALIKIDGEFMIEDEPKSKWKQKFNRPFKAIDSEIYYSYINDATKYNDPIISTHSDGFNGALRHGGGYRHVYYKTAAMLYNLQYVLGDDLFLDAMKNYFNTWKIAHPYNNDFRNSIIRFTKVDLNWFFDQWLETEKRIDYSVKEKNGTITFKRKSRMQMPIDFRIIAKDGKTYNYHIPNNWFVKKTDATILKKWQGWDLIYPEYEVKLDIPAGIEEVIIDPSFRLADAYMPDNSSKFNTKINFDHKLYEYPDWKNYEINHRPDLWWNNYDGLKIGYHLNSGYLRHHHLFNINIWYNSGFFQNENLKYDNNFDKYSYRFIYNTNLDNISLNSRINIITEFVAGLHKNKISLDKSDIKRKNRISISFLSLYRTNQKYLLIDNWEKNKMNNRIDIGIEHNYKYLNGKGKVKIQLQSSSLSSDYDYQKLILSSLNNYKINKLKVNTRTFFQIGTGKKWAQESKLGLSGANNEEMMQSKFTRSEGIVSSDFYDYENSTTLYHTGGGLNLRGYTSYVISNNNFSSNNLGISGGALNTEIDFTSYLPYYIKKNKISTYIFADAGVITDEKINRENYNDIFTSLLTDVGFGLTYTFNNFSPLEKVKPLIIRIDFPLYLNQENKTSNINGVKCLIGVNRAF